MKLDRVNTLEGLALRFSASLWPASRTESISSAPPVLVALGLVAGARLAKHGAVGMEDLAEGARAD